MKASFCASVFIYCVDKDECHPLTFTNPRASRPCSCISRGSSDTSPMLPIDKRTILLDDVMHEATILLAPACVQGMGDIEDITSANGGTTACLKCPWHDFNMALCDGQRFYQALKTLPTGEHVPGPWTVAGVKQRVHQCCEDSGSMCALSN